MIPHITSVAFVPNVAFCAETFQLGRVRIAKFFSNPLNRTKTFFTLRIVVVFERTGVTVESVEGQFTLTFSGFFVARSIDGTRLVGAFTRNALGKVEIPISALVA